MSLKPPDSLSTEELQLEDAGTFDVTQLKFEGSRGDPARHLNRQQLLDALAALPPAPKNAGTVDLLVARPAVGARSLPQEARLTVEGGMPGDRFANQTKYGSRHQLATTRTDFAKLVGNGQDLEIHGDNLFLSLDLSVDNLPTGSRLRVGGALLEVTPESHNGCKKWVQRVGLAAMKLNMEPAQQIAHLRGIYLRVVEDGLVRVGDSATVVSRPA